MTVKTTDTHVQVVGPQGDVRWQTQRGPGAKARAYKFIEAQR